jgi:putative membrane protein
VPRPGTTAAATATPARLIEKLSACPRRLCDDDRRQATPSSGAATYSAISRSGQDNIRLRFHDRGKDFHGYHPAIARVVAAENGLEIELIQQLRLSHMIKNFRDHSSNERTFLAWVRTAIAVMAFGFIVEKFDLFLEIAAPSLAGHRLSLPGQKFGNIAGLALIVLGTAMGAIAAIRFLITAKNIDSEQMRSRSGSRVDVALAALLVLLGSALFIYLSHALVTSPGS